MKEAVIYDMFEYLGADASLYNYATISLNGEYKGVYLALEGVEKSFMLRNFGTQDGELYKPDPMEMGGGQKSASSGQGGPGGMKPPEGMEMPEGFEPPEGMEPPSGDFPGGDFDPEKMPDMGEMPDAGSEESEASGKSGNRTGGGGGGPMMGGNGANLNYTDDDLDSYSSIWDGALSGTSDADHRRVVTALKNISEGTDLEEYLDVDNILKYMAVHTFSVNQDSLSGNMAHNYYLYEYEGKLNMFPWDYNLSVGGFSMGGMGGGGGATSIVNSPIDSPVAMGDVSSRPMVAWIFENEAYTALYHEIYAEFMAKIFDCGWFSAHMAGVIDMISPYVQQEKSAFFTYEEFRNGAQTLLQFADLRVRSVSGQLEGSIPSTTAGQREDSSALIDASHIALADMGEFGMGGGRGRMPGRGASSDAPMASDAGAGEGQQPGRAPGGEGERPPFGRAQGEGGQRRMPGDGERAETSADANTAPDMGNRQRRGLGAGGEHGGESDMRREFSGGIPGGFSPPGKQKNASSGDPAQKGYLLGACALALAAALVFAGRSKPHQ